MLAQVDNACLDLFSQQQSLLHKLRCLSPAIPDTTGVAGAYQHVVLEVPCALLPVGGIPKAEGTLEISLDDFAWPSSPTMIDSDAEIQSSDLDMSSDSS